MRKQVVQRPKDLSAWLDLGWHYKHEGDALAADSGDGDHSPPDPTPSYSEALECFNRAAELGATGFAVRSSQALLADAIGEKQAAKSFAEEALRITPSDSHGNEDEVRLLQEIVARDVPSPTAFQEEQDRQKRVRDRRRESLPRVLRWPLDLIETPAS